MALTNYVIMPGEDYQAICDKVRAKTGKTDVIKSGDLATEIDGISGGGGGTSDDERVKYVTFMYGEVELLKYPVISGDTCHDPVAKGYIDTPTKEQTVSTVYTYSGWALTDGGAASSSALANVTEDRTVYVAFTESARMYTINFYDGETLLKSMQVPYGTTPSYGANPTKDDYSFGGWQPAFVPVTGDADYYAQWEEKVTFAGSSWAKISEVSQNGLASSTFSIGDKRDIECNGYTLTAEIVAFDAKTLSPYRKKCIVCVITSGYPNPQPYESSGERKSWSVSSLRKYCNETIYTGLQDDLKAVVAQSRNYQMNTSLSSENTYDYCWVPNSVEVNAKVGSESGDVFTGLNTAAKRDIDNPWWLRTCGTSGSTARSIDANGAEKQEANTLNKYIRFGFCI